MVLLKADNFAEEDKFGKLSRLNPLIRLISHIKINGQLMFDYFFNCDFSSW